MHSMLAAHLRTAPTLKGILVNMSPNIQGSSKGLVHSNTYVCVFPLPPTTIWIINSGPAFDHNEIRARVARAVMDMEASANAFYAGAVWQGTLIKSSSATRIKKWLPVVSNLPTTSSSFLAPSSATRFLPDSRQTAILSKIRRGAGISSYELQGLLEQCGVCKKHFASSVLFHHIFLCSCD